jgi:DNA-binding transcriptional MerR regulator
MEPKPLPPELIEKKYFTIGEAADMLGVNRSVLRFWETEFEEISPRKTRKGRRMYNHKDIELLQQIHFLVKVKKFTLQGAREKLRLDAQARKENHAAPVPPTAELRKTLLDVRRFLTDLQAKL